MEAKKLDEQLRVCGDMIVTELKNMQSAKTQKAVKSHQTAARFWRELKNTLSEIKEIRPGWISAENTELVPEGTEVIGYSAKWIDEDFNPKGTRACFLNGDGTWVSAKWYDYQDTYQDDDKIPPTHFMLIPEGPEQIVKGIND